MEIDKATLDLFLRLVAALGIGLLIGIERGWKERSLPPGGRTAGIRTFALIGILGGVSGALCQILGPLPLVAIVLALIGPVAWFNYRETERQGDYSVTTLVAALLVFVLGAFAVLGSPQIAAAAAILAVILLAARDSLHAWLRKLTWQELRSGLLLAAMTFLALPLLPDRTIDPWGAVNPHALWLYTIFIAAISAAAYVAIKVAGPSRGIVFGSFVGGLVSSTAATVAAARLARKGGSLAFLAAATALATLASFCRVLVLVVVLAPGMLEGVAAALVPASAILVLAMLYLWRIAPPQPQSLDPDALKNPVQIGFVLWFGLLLAIVFVLAKLLARAFGPAGFIGLGAVTGLVDVDPIVLTATRLAKAGQGEVAVAGALAAVGVNTAVKIGIGFAVAGRGLGLRLTGLIALALAAGAAGFAALEFTQF